MVHTVLIDDSDRPQRECAPLLAASQNVLDDISVEAGMTADL
jgi:hypothetical protein